MNKKYEKYINYIVNDIKPPYFINMRDHYGLKDNEYSFVLSKLYDQPVTIKGISVYDTNGKVIYQEDSDDDWYKYKYNTNGNIIYSEYSDGEWFKYKYDTNGNLNYRGDSNGNWAKWEYDANGNEIYFEDSDGYIRDDR